MSGVATDQIIKQMCRETGEPGFHNYTTLQGYMLDCIVDLNIFSMPTWSTQTSALTPFNTINWACDCVKPLVTVLIRNGHYYLLSVSEDIVGTILPNNSGQNDTCDLADLYSLDGFVETFGWNIWSWGLGELYGAETMLPPFGYVIHDKQNRQSYIKGVQVQTGDRICQFFKSNGLSECPEYVPYECKEVAEFFILMKWFRVRNPNLSAEMDNKYKERLFRLERFNQQGDADQWTRAMNSNSNSAPKA